MKYMPRHITFEIGVIFDIYDALSMMEFLFVINPSNHEFSEAILFQNDRKEARTNP